MTVATAPVEASSGQRRGLGRDFAVFCVGQTVSSVGTAFTRFGLPLLVFKLTGSPTDLALTTAATFLPVVLFGLVVGGLVIERTDQVLPVYAAISGLILLLPFAFAALALPNNRGREEPVTQAG